MVGFCGSRALPASAADSALIAGVVGSVLAAFPRRGVAVGCAVGGDALVVSAALAARRFLSAASLRRLRPRLPDLARRPRLCSRRLFLRLLGLRRCRRSSRRRLRYLVGRGRSLGPPRRPPRLALGRPRLGGRRLRCGSRLCRVRLLVLSVRPHPAPSPSACFSGSGSGSWASLALASGLGLPIVVFPVGAQASAGPESVFPVSWGSWVPARRRPDRTPPGRAVSASGPLLLPSSAARRGGRRSENSAYVWEEFRRERRRRAYSAGGGEGVPRAARNTEVLEYRPYEDGYLQLELRRYVCRYGSTRECGPYWYFQYHEGGKRKKLYLGKTNDPEGNLRVPWQLSEQSTQRGRLLHDGAPHARHGAPAWSTCTSVKRFQHVALVHLQELTATRPVRASTQRTPDRLRPTENPIDKIDLPDAQGRSRTYIGELTRRRSLVRTQHRPLIKSGSLQVKPEMVGQSKSSAQSVIHQ